MLTVVDKPVIQYVVDEALEAGIEHFIFVTGRSKAVIEDYFDIQFELDQTLRERNKKAELDAARRHPAGGGRRPASPASRSRSASAMRSGARREIVGDEPFALLLPDMIMTGGEGLPDGHGRALRARAAATSSPSRNAHPDQAHKYGIVGVGDDGRRRLPDHRRWSRSRPGHGAVELLHQRPLHPAAGDLLDPRNPGARRRQRDPADRRAC